MAEAAEVARLAYETARQRVSSLSDALSNTRTIAIFDEAKPKGAVDYTRCRREITQAAVNVGQDFKVALLTEAVVTHAADYTEAMAALDP